MKKLSLLLVLIVLTACLQACQGLSGHPIEDMQNILVVGIDLEGDDILITFVADTMQESATPGEEQSGTKIYMETGQTIFDVKRKLHEHADKHVTWDHLKYIVVGENAAKKGIDRLLVFFCENEENNLTHDVLVAKGTSATKLIQQTNTEKTSVYDMLLSLEQETQHTGKSFDFSLLQYVIARERPWDDLSIPAIEIQYNPIVDKETYKQEISLRRKGFALFNDDKLVGFLNDDASKGFNYIENKMESTAVVVQDPSGLNVSLEITSSSAKIEPDYDTMSAEIEIDVKSNLVEYFETDDIFDENYIYHLQDAQSAVIQKEVGQTISAAQELGVDVIGMGDAFYHKDAHLWQDLKNDWKNTFKNLDISVKVYSSIQCSYNFQNALGS